MKESLHSQSFLSFQFAGSIKKRYKSQMDFYKYALPDAQNGNYDYKKGDYRGFENFVAELVDFKHWKRLFENIPNLRSDELIGMEVFLYDILRKLLQIKDGPVVVLDVGGLIGMTWNRLAKHFKSEIENSRIAFVVSSVNYKPNKKCINTLSNEENDLLARNLDLIHYLTGRTSQLRRATITLPNGTDIKLEGNTDLIYEKHSLTPWSKIPDIEILRLGKLVSPYGFYFVRRMDVVNHYGHNIPFQSIEEQRYNRDVAIKFAHEQLVSKYGLKRVYSIEDGDLASQSMRYFVFKGKKAPKIAVNLNPKLRMS